MNTDPDGGSNRPKTVASSAAGDPVPRLSGVHAIAEASTILTRTNVDGTNLFSSPSWALGLSLLSEQNAVVITSGTVQRPRERRRRQPATIGCCGPFDHEREGF